MTKWIEIANILIRTDRIEEMRKFNDIAPCLGIKKEGEDEETFSFSTEQERDNVYERIKNYLPGEKAFI